MQGYYHYPAQRNLKQFMFMPPPKATVPIPEGKQLINDTTITGVWDGGGKVLRITDYMVYGPGTLENWIIDAPLTNEIFDTSLNLKNISTYNGKFSTLWYGTKSNNPDNWWNIQKSINYCKNTNLELHTPGNGLYKYSKTLDISNKINGRYQQCQITLTGDASYWDRGNGTTFQYTGATEPAMNFQLNKGSKFRNIAVRGLFKCPGGVDSIYYNLTEANYKDQSGLNLPDTYTGVAIDYYYDGISRSGSTGIEMTDISIGGFAVGLSFSANRITQNNDAHVIDKIHFFDNKWHIVTGQPQEKGTSINHIYSWGSCYNVFKNFGAGDYNMSVANIAGRCIEPVQAQIGRWFSTKINGWFCESIGRVCTVSALMPFKFQDCTFDLNFSYSRERVVINSNSTEVSFTGCNFRYYDGKGGDIWVKGAATFNNCYVYFGKIVYK